MTTPVIDASREAKVDSFAKSAMEVSLDFIYALSLEERRALVRMLEEFVEASDEETKEEVAVSIIEMVSPSHESEERISMSLDEWIDSEKDLDEAIADLTASKQRFAEKVKTLMAKRDLSQVQFAELLGISQPTVSKILSGQHKPQPKTLRKIADALQVPVEELWKPPPQK